MNTRYRLPLKVALALTLAIVIALWLGWDKPYWAAFSVVVMAVTETSGHSLEKGRQRIAGTIFGVVVAFVLIGLFAQQPVHLLLSYTLFSALCVYQQTNPRYGYIWSIGMMVATLVMIMGGLSGTQTFDIAVLRLQETILGVFCFSLVFSLMWPASSRVVLFDTLKSYFDNQVGFVEQALADLAQTGNLKRDYSFGNSIKRLSRLEDLIQAASADSYEISSTSSHWQQLWHQQNEWTILCGHLYESLRLLNAPLSEVQREKVSRVLGHLQQRAGNASLLLTHYRNQNAYLEPITSKPWLIVPPLESISLLVKDDDIEDQRHGALQMLENILNQMDALHHSMYKTLLEAVETKPYNTVQPSNHSDKRQRQWQFVIPIDPERLVNAFKACLMIWISIALWLYVPMPGGPMIVMFGACFGAVVLSLPFASTRSLLFYMLGWGSAVLVQYVFILPHMSEIWQLAAFYFLNTFVIWSVFNKPQHIFHRMLGTMNLVLMTKSAMQLSPTYDIQAALLIMLLLSVGMLVIFFVNHGVYSANPERIFLRHLGYFRRNLQSGLQSQLSGRPMKMVRVVRPALVRDIAIAEAAQGMINWRTFPDLTQSDAQQLISQGYSLCLHYKAFVDSYQHWLKNTYSHSIDKQIQRSIVDMVKLLDKSMISEESTVHRAGLNQLQQHLQAYLYGFEQHSLLQFTFSQQQADQSYQLLVSLQILIESLQQMQQATSLNDFHTLRLSPFTI